MHHGVFKTNPTHALTFDLMASQVIQLYIPQMQGNHRNGIPPVSSSSSQDLFEIANHHKSPTSLTERLQQLLKTLKHPVALTCLTHNADKVTTLRFALVPG